jgi:hypothetical protein
LVTLVGVWAIVHGVAEIFAAFSVRQTSRRAEHLGRLTAGRPGIGTDRSGAQVTSGLACSKTLEQAGTARPRAGDRRTGQTPTP